MDVSSLNTVAAKIYKEELKTVQIENDFVGQTFICNYPNLSRIDVILSSPENSYRELIFHLKTSADDKKDLTTIHISTHNVINGSYYHINFPTQKNSMGRKYYFCLEGLRGKIPSVLEPPGIKYLENNPYSNGEMYVNDKELEDCDLIFRTYFIR